MMAVKKKKVKEYETLCAKHSCKKGRMYTMILFKVQQ